MALVPISTSVHQNTPETLLQGNQLLRESHLAREHANALGEQIKLLQKERTEASQLAEEKLMRASQLLLGVVTLGD